MKRLLVLGAGQIQVPIIKLAKQLGFYTIAVDYNPHAPGLEYADMSYDISTIDKDAVLNIAREQKINGILTTSDYPVRVVSYIGELLGLPCMSQSVSNICTNKYEQRIFFKKAGITTPFFIQCDTNSDISQLFNFPYIVKPVDSSASRGVKKVLSTKQLMEAIKVACENSHTRKAIIEEFIEGDKEYSVEALTQNGITHIIQITEKLTRGEKMGFFVEDTHIEPARINSEYKDIIQQEVLKAIKAIGVDNCPTHTEIKIYNGKPYIIEIACRLGGDYITSDLVPLSTGVNMMENLIKLSVGEKIDINHKYQKWSCVQFLNETNYYRCKEFIESRDFHIKKFEIGEYSNDVIKSSVDRLGYIIIQADTQNEIEEILKIIK